MTTFNTINFNGTQIDPTQFPAYELETPFTTSGVGRHLKGLNPQFADLSLVKFRQDNVINIHFIHEGLDKSIQDAAEHGTRRKALALAGSALLISLIAATVLMAVFCPPALAGLALLPGLSAFVLSLALNACACEMIKGPFEHLITNWPLFALLLPFAPILLPYAVFTQTSRLEGQRNELVDPINQSIAGIRVEGNFQSICEQLQKDLQAQAKKYQQALSTELNPQVEGLRRAIEKMQTIEGQIQQNKEAQKYIADVLAFIAPQPLSE